MHLKSLIFLCVMLSFIALCNAYDDDQSLESRGKKKKKQYYYGLYLTIADLVVKKIFVLKLVYAFVLWCVIHKAGYFLGWFVTILKSHKHHHHEHHEPHYEHHGSHYDSYSPYRRQIMENRAF